MLSVRSLFLEQLVMSVVSSLATVLLVKAAAFLNTDLLINTGAEDARDDRLELSAGGVVALSCPGLCLVSYNTRTSAESFKGLSTSSAV